MNYLELKLDDQLIFKQAIDKVNIAETRAIYTLMDFKTMRNKGTRFYKLYIDDGNNLKFYDESPGTGKIKIDPSKPESAIEIIMKDTDGNASNVSFRLKSDELAKEVPTLGAMKEELSTDIMENTLMITAKPCAVSEHKARVFLNGRQWKCRPIFQCNQAWYLMDLRSNPHSILVCERRFFK